MFLICPAIFSYGLLLIKFTASSSIRANLPIFFKYTYPELLHLFFKCHSSAMREICSNTATVLYTVLNRGALLLLQEKPHCAMPISSCLLIHSGTQFTFDFVFYSFLQVALFIKCKQMFFPKYVRNLCTSFLSVFSKISFLTVGFVFFLFHRFWQVFFRFMVNVLF